MPTPLWEHYKLVIPANHFLINFRHEMPGVPDQLICTYGLAVGAGASDLAAFEDLADAWNDEVVSGLFHTSQSFVQMTVSDATGVILSIDRGDAGGDSGAMSPVSNALLVEKRTGLSGRSNRGRVFIPCVREDAVDNTGRLTDVHRTGVTTALEAFRTAVEAIDPGEWFLCLLHTKKWNGSSEPPDPGSGPGMAPNPTPITSHYTRSIIGTQRRRLR